MNPLPDLQTLLTKSFNEETIPFQAIRESVNVTLEKTKPKNLPKKRYARANQAPSVNKEIMKTSRLKNKFLSTRIDLDGKAYNKQRNYVVSLY